MAWPYWRTILSPCDLLSFEHLIEAYADFEDVLFGKPPQETSETRLMSVLKTLRELTLSVIVIQFDCRFGLDRFEWHSWISSESKPAGPKSEFADRGGINAIVSRVVFEPRRVHLS